MKCCEFERRLQRLLDERKDATLVAGAFPSRMQRHTDGCTDCTELLAGYRALLSALHGGCPEASAFSAANIVDVSTPTRHPARWYRALGPFATAASLLFTGWMVYQGEPVPTEPQAGPSVVREATPTATLPPVVVAPQTLAVALPTGAAKPLRIAQPMMIDERSLGLVLNLAGLSPVTFSADLLDSPLVEKPWWMLQVSDGLKPVAERMTGTLNALWQVLPGASAPQEESQGARYDQYSRYDQVA